MVRRCVRYRNLVNKEALTHWGLSHQNKKKKTKRNGWLLIKIFNTDREWCVADWQFRKHEVMDKDKGH